MAICPMRSSITPSGVVVIIGSSVGFSAPASGGARGPPRQLSRLSLAMLTIMRNAGTSRKTE
jgi:hypothetical protein